MNIDMSQYQALVRREFWEHRGAFFTTPAVISTVIIGFTILGLIWFYHVAGGTRPPSGSAEELSVLGDTLIWIPITFGVLVVPLFLWAMRIKKMRSFE